jgi:hypothetical protein
MSSAALVVVPLTVLHATGAVNSPGTAHALTHQVLRDALTGDTRPDDALTRAGGRSAVPRATPGHWERQHPVDPAGLLAGVPIVVHPVLAVGARSTAKPNSASRDPDTHDRVGDATWYAWHPGQCAVHYLPRGTRIWITDLATGKTVTCLVTDYEADGSRAVDMDEAVFAELAPPAAGVIRVKVTW